MMPPNPPTPPDQGGSSSADEASQIWESLSAELGMKLLDEFQLLYRPGQISMVLFLNGPEEAYQYCSAWLSRRNGRKGSGVKN